MKSTARAIFVENTHGNLSIYSDYNGSHNIHVLFLEQKFHATLHQLTSVFVSLLGGVGARHNLLRTPWAFRNIITHI